MWPHDYTPRSSPYKFLIEETGNPSLCNCPKTPFDDKLGHAFLIYRLAKVCELEDPYSGRPLDKATCVELTQQWKNMALQQNIKRNSYLENNGVKNCVIREDFIKENFLKFDECSSSLKEKI